MQRHCQCQYLAEATQWAADLKMVETETFNIVGWLLCMRETDNHERNLVGNISLSIFLRFGQARKGPIEGKEFLSFSESCFKDQFIIYH